MTSEDIENENVGPLSAKIFQYTKIVKDLSARAKQPGYSRDDWDSLAELVAVDEFVRTGIWRESMTWQEYLDFMVPWAEWKDFDTRLRRVTETGNFVFFEIEEHHIREDDVVIVNSMNVYQFNDDEKICSLDVYLQGQLGSMAFKSP